MKNYIRIILCACLMTITFQAFSETGTLPSWLRGELGEQYKLSKERTKMECWELNHFLQEVITLHKDLNKIVEDHINELHQLENFRLKFPSKYKQKVIAGTKKVLDGYLFMNNKLTEYENSYNTNIYPYKQYSDTYKGKYAKLIIELNILSAQVFSLNLNFKINEDKNIFKSLKLVERQINLKKSEISSFLNSIEDHFYEVSDTYTDFYNSIETEKNLMGIPKSI